MVRQERRLRERSQLLLHYDDPERFMREVLELADLLRSAPEDTSFELKVTGDYAALVPQDHA